jgi:glycerophosphoryl diester phosphodiesterase
MELCTHGKPITGYCQPCAQAIDGGDNMLLMVKIREVYGNKRVYVQSFQAGALKALTGRETLTDSDIKALKSLGYSFQVLGNSIL